MDFVINCARTPGWPSAKRIRSRPRSAHENRLRMNLDVNAKTETKVLEEKIAGNPL